MYQYCHLVKSLLFLLSSNPLAGSLKEVKHSTLTGIFLGLFLISVTPPINAQELVGEWNLVEGTYNNAPIADLSASLVITDAQNTINYEAEFDNGTHDGDVRAQYSLSGNTFITNIDGNSLILNGFSSQFTSSGGQFITLWSASMNISVSIFNQWGATAIGFNEPTFQVVDNTLTLTSANGNTELIYMRDPVSSNETVRSDSDHFSLQRIYPNPFTSETLFEYTLDKATQVQLSIFNSIGQLVGQLLNDRKQAGTHSVTWMPEGLPPGIYSYRLKMGQKVQAGKLIMEN